MAPARDGIGSDGAGDSTFGDVRPEWLGRLGNVRNVVRQEMISRQLGRHMRKHPARVLDVFTALAVRTTTSALWRPAARQDWRAALAAFEEYDAARIEGRDMRYINEIGTPARADDLETLTAAAAAHGLELENWYGVRIAADMEELDPPAPSDPGQLAALFDVEERLGAADPYRQLGQLAHLILRKPGGAVTVKR